MSANHQDARPFVDLNNDAEEFMEKFHEDIKRISSFLDEKLTLLICDPDSLHSPTKKSAVKSSPAVEFSKAKYDIFTSTKNLVNQMEHEWLKYITEMKKLFIENVEILLAGTKLEVKLPSNDLKSPSGHSKSPLKERSSIGSSIYPVFNCFSKNMAAFGSPLLGKDATETNRSKESTKAPQQKDSIQDKAGRAYVKLFRNIDALAEICANKSLSRVSSASSKKYSEKDISSSEVSDDDTAAKRSSLRELSAPKRDDADYSSSEVSDEDSDFDVKMSQYPARKISTSQQSARGRSSSRNSRLSNSTDSDVKMSQARKSTSQQSARGRSSSRNSELSNSTVERKSPPKSSKPVKKNAAQAQPVDKIALSSESESEEGNAEPKETKGRPKRGAKFAAAVISTPKRTRGKPTTAKSSTSDDKVPEVALKRTSTPVTETKASPEREVSQTRSTRQSKTAVKENEVSQTRTTRRGKTTVKENEVSQTRTTRRGKAAVKDTSTKRGMTSEESGDTSTAESSSSAVRSTRQRGPAKSAKTVKSPSLSARVKGRSQTAVSKIFDTKILPAEKLFDNETPVKSNLASDSTSVEKGYPKSPKKVTFSPSKQVTDDLDNSTPIVQGKSSVRRKTLLPNLSETVSDMALTPKASQSRGKRKTISGFSSLDAESPPKRLKGSEKRKSGSSNQVEENTNFLESDGKYSDWIPLKNIDAKIPAKSGIYEVKVWRAKKSAYIGHCESLRQKLTLHKLLQNTGHKHLDKFVERNKDDIQIRFEVMPSTDVAKTEVKNRVKSFVEQYNTTPAYN